MGGIATPLAGQMLPTVSSPGRQVPNLKIPSGYITHI